MIPEVIHQAEAQRFVLPLESTEAILAYSLQPGVMSLTHTFVPQSLRGKGLAEQLVRGALAYARVHHLKIRPICSYVDIFMQRHPEYLDLMESGHEPER